jgi:hypothetical protein
MLWSFGTMMGDMTGAASSRVVARTVDSKAAEDVVVGAFEDVGGVMDGVEGRSVR